MEVGSPPIVEIERNPKRCGGDPVLAGTRMGVHDIVSYWRLYDGDVQRVVDDFPHLMVGQVEAVLAWYRDHQEEIDAILRRRQEDHQRIVAESRARRAAARDSGATDR
jgi:uncharacterized protein (DUF433 family)